MTAKGQDSLDWDLNGRLVSGIDVDMAHDPEGKLRSASSGGTTLDLAYEPVRGMRIRRDKTVGQSTTCRKYIVDTQARLPIILLELDPDESDPNDGVIGTYVYVHGQIVAQHAGHYESPMYFYLHDRLGSVRQVIDTDGAVKNTYTYDPWGQAFATEVEITVDNPFLFTGQYFDAEINQYHLRARQYDPQLYRFTARDPAEGSFQEALTLHPYLYALNNPINRSDPTGEFSFIGSVGAVAQWAWMQGKEFATKVGPARAAMSQLELGVTTLNALRCGMMNMWLGPDNLSDTAKFAVGFVSGGVSMQIGLRAGAAASGAFGAAFTGTMNTVLSEDGLSWEKAIRVGINTGLAAAGGALAQWWNPMEAADKWSLFMLDLDRQVITYDFWQFVDFWR